MAGSRLCKSLKSRLLGVVFGVLWLGVTSATAVEIAAPESFDCLVQPSAEVELSAPSAGVVSEVLVDRGDRVARGQVVARLNDTLERANLAVAEHRAATSATLKLRTARLEYEERRLARNANLIAEAVLTEKEAEEMRMARDMAYWEHKEVEEQALLAGLQVEQAKAELSLRQVRAPVDGVVTELKRKAGENSSGSYIMKLVKLDPLYIETFVPAPLAVKLRVGQQVSIMNETIDRPWQAQISVVDSVADAASGMLKVRVEVANAGYDKLAGLRCSATFEWD